MRIDEVISNVKNSDGTTQKVCANIWYTTDEASDLANITEYGEGSVAYCYSGDSKGVVKVFDGENWVAQE